MKTSWGTAFVILAAIFTSGCVVSIGSRTVPPPADVPPPPPALVVGDPAEAATIAEIDAAARLNLDSARTQVLSQIAERPTLTATAQVHLVNVAYRRLSLDDSKVQILNKVIARPDFCDATRHAMVTQLNYLSFDSNKQAILQRINERLAQPVEH